MRRGKHEYKLAKMQILNDKTVSDFQTLYMEYYNIDASKIEAIAFDKWGDYFQFSTLAAWQTLFQSANFQERQILIVGDYDVDGIMASKIALWLCQRCGVEIVDVYIPNRFVDGYGLNRKIVEKAHEDGFDTILTVDNGISAFEAIAYAKEVGIEVLLTDHHQIKEQVPEASLILHPDLGEVNNHKNICGAAVIFALAYTLFEEESKLLLPYVMLATLADSMELCYLNRCFVIEGMQIVGKLADPFLKQLMQQLEVDLKDASSFAWKLIPVLNAIGRMGDVNHFAEVLFWQEEAVLSAVEACIEMNDWRKRETEKIMNDVRALSFSATLICAASPSWHQGVLGIAASRLMEEKQKPVLLFAQNDNVYKGSGRSPENFDLFAFLQQHENDIHAFGGHANACGLTLIDSQYDNLVKQAAQLPAYMPTPREIGFNIQQLQTKELQVLYKALQKLEPFGNGMPKPLFHQVAREKEIRQLGSERQHVKCTLPNQMQLLFFNESEKWRITEQAQIQTTGHLSLNRWQDTITFQVIVDDWWIDEVELFYPNQLQPQDAEKLFTVKAIPQSEAEFAQLKKEVQKRGLVVFAWQDAQKDVAFVSDEQLRMIYKYFLKQETVTQNDALYELFRRNGIEKKAVNFAIMVFLELEFVIIKNGVIKIQDNTIKRRLSDSKHYQKMQFQHSFIQNVVYAPNEKIKELFIYLEDEQ